ncbi:MAG: hypothetical protein QXO07_01315 [Candidatus Aenigmatarchaeota archaeon]
MDGVTPNVNIEQKEQIEQEEMEWTVAEILARIQSGVKYDWIMIFVNDEDDDPWVWTKQTGWNFEPVPYNKKVKDFWLERDGDSIGVKIILKEDE